MPVDHYQSVIRNMLVSLKGLMTWLRLKHPYHKEVKLSKNRLLRGPKVITQPKGHFYKQNRQREHRGIHTQRVAQHNTSKPSRNQR